MACPAGPRIIRARIDARSVEQAVNLDDDVFNWPMLYAVRPGEWDLTDLQTKKFKEYLDRGRFFECDFLGHVRVGYVHAEYRDPETGAGGGTGVVASCPPWSPPGGIAGPEKEETRAGWASRPLLQKLAYFGFSLGP